MSDLTIPEHDATSDLTTSPGHAHHLPECFAHESNAWSWKNECICEALRSCITRAANVVANYAEERLVITGYPNRSEDITAALRAASIRVNALRGDQK